MIHIVKLGLLLSFKFFSASFLVLKSSITQQQYLQFSFLVTMATDEDKVVAFETPSEWISLFLLLLHCCRW